MNSHTKEKTALGIFILSITALIILIFLTFQGNFTGRVIQETKENIQPSCSDSDERNYDVRGRVDYCTIDGCSSEEDSCSEKVLKEWYCEGDKAVFEEKTCENDCDSGACLTLVDKYYYPYSGGGGGGGSSSGGTSPVPTPAVTGQTYDLGELTADQNPEIQKNDNIRFTISGTEYILTLTDNTATEVTINTNTGKTLNLAVSSDGSEDNSAGFYIKLKSINTITGKVSLLLRAFP